MIRGTTPTLEFELPISVSDIADAYVSFAQQGKVIIDKQLADCSCGANTLTVRLTQEETLKLESGLVIEMQLRVRTTADNALASQIMKVNIDRILRDGVI